MSKLARIFGITVLVLTGILFAQFAPLPFAHSTTDTTQFSRKVNLALRRTAHHLLRNAGDDTSRIAPVNQQNAYTFSVQLDRPFDYSQLPALLQESFRIHEIRANYDVAVLDCAHGELQLGYNFRDLTENKEVPCEGRKQVNGCYKLQVTFATSETASQPPVLGWILALGVVMTGFGYVVWRKSASTSALGSTSESNQQESRLVRFGESSLDCTTQTLISGAARHNLTYREAKLLRYLIDHANQVIERDRILKSVWEDEGIFVGRSVDVFVSRLRKLLQADPTVRIVAVHGVGYRLEVQ
ncbi:winged helix-turn-helix domain-containing protein [Spirosoma validum]|uniref:Winged helix-turn-helix transcriptional regulator n=1 Tax=Spirosoma validum TaxID=2771355 RepID=A0A927B606_9BACT|nr:winged helix-turn-helix domain-containing protein [Spirosoma validum]MBD2755881.1 winged helix-turn-helix transcriptional regulator [Spirosoma validum]